MLMQAARQQWVIRLDGSTLPDRALIGGKAWSVARMIALGLPVPPAFVVTTQACRDYLETGSFPDELQRQIDEGVAWLEKATGARFGSPDKPLLVSVRSGAPVSMPGMMDTILNLGITQQTEAAIAKTFGDPEFARDVHRRFFDLYSHIVLKADVEHFGMDGDEAHWNALIKASCGETVPESVAERLRSAIIAVFNSWNSRRARRYREHHNISHDLGTAVTVQAMVFGNMDGKSGTGVLFSRNPLTGDPEPFGEYLPRAQGEDIVSGKFTPKPLSVMREIVPQAHGELLRAASVLERDGSDVQDIEFTVQAGVLYLLQARAAKRAPAASVRFAVDMVREGIIDEKTAISRVSADQVRLLLAPRLAREPDASALVLASGDGACPGVGAGVVVTDADEAEARTKAGEAVVLARPTTSPEDVHGMLVAKAIITEAGGSTSHAAVISRALGLPCVVGCGSGTVTRLAGQTVTVEGSLGQVFEGLMDVETPDETHDERLALLAQWARGLSPIAVHRPHEAPAGAILDLSAVEGGEDPEKIGGLLAGARAARGGAIASEAGVRAALANRLEFILAEPVLPVLLSAIHAAAANEEAGSREGNQQ
jgi:pyruvate,orthophosphate dikinase